LNAEPDTSAAGYAPRRPTLVASGFFALWIAILSLPMLAGRWLATSPWSDQYAAGYAFRTWGAEQLRRTGHVPLWNPEMFGGLPFVAALHGDIFYPTSWLRLFFSMPAVMDLGFVIHYVAAGLFTYLLLRRLSVPWIGALIGGLGYQLSGLIASYPLPGHDGKLFVSTMLPLAMLALVLALRERRWSGYALLALSVGLALLSPHFQTTYYLLIAAGLFALYLTFGEATDEPLGPRVGRLALALAAVLLGFGVSAIQVLPFYDYLPFSPRAAGYRGFEGATSYAIPWVHVPEFFLKRFTGLKETYWGPNGLKLHSEYLGLPVIALAALGVGAAGRRRLVWWLGGIGLLFLLISLGASTPFYAVWWTVMPYVKQTRAPGMAFYVVALVVAMLAALGAARLEKKEGARHVRVWWIVAAVALVLAVIGAFGAMAMSAARTVQATLGGQSIAAAQAGQSAIRWGAATSAVALALTAGIAVLWLRGRIPVLALATTLALVVGTDLWLNARAYWAYSPEPPALFGPDAITQRIKATAPPYRVLDLAATLGSGLYGVGGVGLMAFDIPQVLGHHSFELNAYDELLGGQGQWRFVGRYPPLWDLLGVRYVIWPGEGQDLAKDSVFMSRFHRVLHDVPTSAGIQADLFERNETVPYARVVPAAAKVPEELLVQTVMNPRLDYARLVLLPQDAPVVTPPLESLPPAMTSRATVGDWKPGAMTVRLDPAPEHDAWLLVSENWYPDWHATVDGRAAQVLRGDKTFITVPVPRGARVVQVWFASRAYAAGMGITLASLALIAVLFALPLVLKRRGG
jgi:hypothetical protein